MLMALPIVLGLASCSDDNLVDPNPLVDKVSGIWWTLIEQEGTTTTGKVYTRVGTGFQLLEDGTGYGATFYFNNDEGDPIEMLGGKDFTPFTYTTSQDGTITLTVTELDYACVTTGTVADFLCYRTKALLHGLLVLQIAEYDATRVGAVILGAGEQRLDVLLQGLGLGEGRSDSFVHDQRD